MPCPFQTSIYYQYSMPFGIFPFLKRLFLSAIAIGCLLVCQDPVAYAAEKKLKINLPAGAASESVQEFAKQSRLQIIYPSDLLAGIRAPNIKGRYAPDEVFALILEDTDLTSLRDEESGAYFIKQKIADPNSVAGKEVIEVGKTGKAKAGPQETQRLGFYSSSGRREQRLCPG